MPAFGDPRAVVLRWQIPPGSAPIRADQHLSEKVGRLSRTRARRVIESGDLRRAGGALKPSSTLRPGDDLELWRIPPDDPGALPTEPGVLFEDDELLVIDKPPDLPVHPSARYLHQTLTRWLRDRASEERERSPERRRIEETRPANPCHRLDRETSGVLVCGKDKSAEVRWKRGFQEGRVQKLYLAVVRGALSERQLIDAPLALQGERGLVRIRMIVDPEGLPSQTEVIPLGPAGDRTLVACVPRTGRQHQIRVHLAHAGFPLVGDKLYAMGDAWFDAWTRGEADEAELEHPRHALHAARVALDDESFHAPLPADLRALVDEESADRADRFKGAP
jgi:23S rRNA pseudouridine1911/1915/1917 synthase